MPEELNGRGDAVRTHGKTEDFDEDVGQLSWFHDADCPPMARSSKFFREVENGATTPIISETLVFALNGWIESVGRKVFRGGAENGTRGRVRSPNSPMIGALPATDATTTLRRRRQSRIIPMKTPIGICKVG